MAITLYFSGFSPATLEKIRPATTHRSPPDDHALLYRQCAITF